MKYMLDTNIIVYLLNNRPVSIRERFFAYPPTEFCVSSVTYAELMYGIEKSASPDRNLARLLLLLANIEVLNWDPFAAVEYGKIQAGLEKMGTPIGPLDILIAAHAKSLGCTLITHNTREFDRVEGLLVEDWT